MAMTASSPRLTTTDMGLLRRLEPDHLLEVVTALAEDGWSGGGRALRRFRAMAEYQPEYRKQQTQREEWR
jgi:hypothetical protein